MVRAAGVSPGRIAGSALKGATALVNSSRPCSGKSSLPGGERLARTGREAALEELPGRDDGAWIRDGQRFVNMVRVRPGDRVEDMYIYELDSWGALRAVMHAEHARYRDSAWVLEAVRRSEVSAAGVVTRSTPRTVWETRFGPDLVKLASARREGLSGLALARYIDYLRDNRLDTAAYELALWRKVAYPFATGVMIVLAVPLVLGRLGGAGIGQRILAGCLIAVTFHIVNEASGKLGIVYGLSPPVSAFAPTLSFLAVGMWLLHRVR